jgi:peptide/nickel transport system substrate-binding protein
VDYVGSGPYKLREYAAGQRIILDAFDKYLPGRAKVDEIEVPYIPDPSTVLSNILAGSVDMTVGIGLPVDPVVELRDRWPDGKFTFEFSDQRWFRLDPQFIDPTPSVVTDLRFRRAMLYAIDRQELADSLQAGIAPVAETLMSPNQPEYAGIASRVMKYEYDPARTTRMLEELGYQRGGDGMMRDASGKVLEVEVAGANDTVTKPMLAVANYWQRVGVASNTFVVPPQRATDWPWRATFSSFALFTGTNDLAVLPALKSTQARTAQNNYEVSGLPNWPRYQNAEVDELVDRFFRTIPKSERIEVLTRINQHIFENLSTMGLYYFPTPYAVANRVANVPVNRGARASLTWNAHEWEVRS